jgi:hypothetical protein
VVRFLWAVVLVMACFGIASMPAAAAPYGIVIGAAPPPPRVEAVPAPRSGYVWVPGYWDWRRRHHVWIPGTWIRQRPGYVYRQPHWVRRGGQWHLQHGHWDRHDRDRDGVPDPYDRHPNNPRRP